MCPVVFRFTLGCLAGVTFAGMVCSQTPTTPTLARVKGRATSIRSAPGEQSPETGILEPGQTVTVVNSEAGDWFAIQPPYGSVSWISATLLEPQGAAGADGLRKPPFNAVVRADTPAPLRAGSIQQNSPLGVQRTRLPEGTIVQVIGQKVKAKANGDDLESSWYPIVAPIDDYRYVRKEALELTSTTATVGYVVKTGATTESPLPGAVPTLPAEPAAKREGDWTLNVPGTIPGRTGGGIGGSKRDNFPNYHPQFREAEQARITGDIKRAEQLYRQVADEVSRDGPNKDVDLANLCYDRIFLLKKGSVGGSSDDWNGTGWRPSNTAPASPALPTMPAAPSYPRAELPRADAPRTEVPRSEIPRLEAPRKEPIAKVADGFLKATTFQLGNRLVYVLTDNKGVVRYYVASGGVDLEKYLGRWVEVSGDETKPRELRGDTLVVVTQITTAR
jgi:hypothetical protein